MGSCLGEMTNELEVYGRGSYAKSFVGCGPKAYGLQIKNSAGENYTIVKVRGFNLNYAASQMLNFDRMKEMMTLFLCGKCSPTVAINYPAIVRTDGHRVMTRNSIKQFKIVYTKRFVRANGTTVPFGY